MGRSVILRYSAAQKNKPANCAKNHHFSCVHEQNADFAFRTDPIRSGLHDRLAQLLGGSLLRVQDHTPGELDHNLRGTDEIIPVQEWMEIAGMTQPLAQRWERNGSMFHRVQGDRGGNGPEQPSGWRISAHGMTTTSTAFQLPGGVTRPSEPGPTAMANEEALHQTDADAASARFPSSSDLAMAGDDWDDVDYRFAHLDHGHDGDDEYDGDYDGAWDDETTWGKGSTTTPTTYYSN